MIIKKETIGGGGVRYRLGNQKFHFDVCNFKSAITTVKYPHLIFNVLVPFFGLIEFACEVSIF